MVARYKQAARAIAELTLGDLMPLVDAIPEPATLREQGPEKGPNSAPGPILTADHRIRSQSGSRASNKRFEAKKKRLLSRSRAETTRRATSVFHGNFTLTRV